MDFQRDFDIQKIKQGDRNAFKRFFEFLYPRLMGLACRFVDDETAKDLVQDVFVEYWEKKQMMDVANVLSYFYKSIQNKCLNHLKHQVVVEGYTERVKIAQARMDYLIHSTDNNEIFKQISNQNLRELIESSVGKLPLKCQNAFRLCYFHEMTCKEAAEIMEVSPRTVEGHLQKAVACLREDLRPLLSWLILSGLIFQS